LEGRRESLKLRDIRAAVELPCVSSNSAPRTRLLSPVHTGPFLQWEGQRELWVLSGRRVVVTTFTATSGAAAELPLSSTATKLAK